MNLLMISSNTKVAAGLRSGNFYNNLTYFGRHFNRVDVICPHVKEAAVKKINANVFIHSLPKGKLLESYYVYKKGLEIFSLTKPNLISAHAYGLQLMSLGAWLLAKKTKTPLILEIHHIEGFPRAATLADWLMKVMSFGFIKIAKSEAVAFRVVNQCELTPLLKSLGVNDQQIVYLCSMYLNKKIFYPSLENESKEYDLIFVGRLISNKGLKQLLEAFTIAKRDLPGIKLIILGDGPLRKWLQRKIRNQNNVFHFLPVPLSEVAGFYKKSKLVVCSSYAEGGPLFVLEAMACGLPAVSTPVGIMKEVVKSDHNGFLLNEWSAKEMAGAIIKILTDEDLYKKCSANAIATAMQFDYEKIVNDYVLTYKKIAQYYENTCHCTGVGF